MFPFVIPLVFFFLYSRRVFSVYIVFPHTLFCYYLRGFHSFFFVLSSDILNVVCLFHLMYPSCFLGVPFMFNLACPCPSCFNGVFFWHVFFVSSVCFFLPSHHVFLGFHLIYFGMQFAFILLCVHLVFFDVSLMFFHPDNFDFNLAFLGLYRVFWRVLNIE